VLETRGLSTGYKTDAIWWAFAFRTRAAQTAAAYLNVFALVLVDANLNAGLIRAESMTNNR
jgi:hypothetical protein